MRKLLEKSRKYEEVIELMYMDKGGTISKRKVKVLHIHSEIFVAYCFLRKAKRTFIIDHVLAAVPIIHKEKTIV